VVFGRFSSDKGSVGHRVTLYRLLHQTIEEHAAGFGSAPVETERELVEVVVQVRRTDRALMDSEPPASQQGCNPVDAWHCDVGGVATRMDVLYNVCVAEVANTAVSHPAISPQFGPRTHASLDKRMQTFCRCVSDSLHPDPTSTATSHFGCYRHQCLPFCTAADGARLASPDVALIYLD